ncbi:hypothetical protein [Halobellus inordinatus]|uniref:hypothetical protein n=1 Tax=Halobellus inordinatus TaxID=1126236 RepID=UPI00210CD1A4|nr:hypothetical protein [Halobellus inordinatus]
MRLWRWLLVLLIAPTVFFAALVATGAVGGAVTGLVGVKMPLAVLGFALIVALAAVYKSGRMVLD